MGEGGPGCLPQIYGGRRPGLSPSDLWGKEARVVSLRFMGEGGPGCLTNCLPCHCGAYGRDMLDLSQYSLINPGRVQDGQLLQYSLR